MRISRRQFLRGAGVAIALPAMEAFAAESAKRMVAINIPLGFHAPNFFPEKAGRDYTMSPYLSAAEDLRDAFTLVSGCSHPQVDGGHAAERSFLTAAPHPGSRSFKNSLSLDQLVARHIGQETRYASLTLGDHSLSWTANGVSLPAERSPGAMFQTLFLSGKATDIAAQKHALGQGRAILDVVREDAKAMAKQVSAADRDKLDQFFTAVRDTEQDLQKQEVWAETPKPEVDVAPPKAIASADLTGRFRANLNIVRLALMTDSSRVIALGGNNGSQVTPLTGVTMGYHALSHHGKNPAMLRELAVIEQETLTIWLDFLRALKATPDGESTLLDQTQVLLGSNLGNASGHLNTNLPVVLAGGPYQHGQHLAFDSRQNEPLAKLFASMLHTLGIDEEFANTRQPLPGLA
jgi:hypothetical protein